MALAMATHTLLAALKAGKPALGTWITLPGFFHARTVAQASSRLSWVVVDCEHGLIPLTPTVSESIAAIHGVKGGPSAIVRIPATGASGSTSWQIKYALDAGARGVIIPMVSTRDKAREIVADSRFPPLGRRGFGSPFTHSNWGINVSEYLQSANENILVMVQIETKEAVQNLKDIVAVDGLDAVFIGPYDLSISHGYPTPDPDPHPVVEKVIQSIRSAAHDAGKKCAMFCTSGRQASQRVAEGFDMVNVALDVNALSDSIAAQAEAALAMR